VRTASGETGVASWTPDSRPRPRHHASACEVGTAFICHQQDDSDLQDPVIALFKKIGAGSGAPTTPSSTIQVRARSVPPSSAISKALHLLQTRKLGLPRPGEESCYKDPLSLWTTIRYLRHTQRGSIREKKGGDAASSHPSKRSTVMEFMLV